MPAFSCHLWQHVQQKYHRTGKRLTVLPHQKPVRFGGEFPVYALQAIPRTIFPHIKDLADICSRLKIIVAFRFSEISAYPLRHLYCHRIQFRQHLYICKSLYFFMHIKQTGQIINPYFYKLILITSHMRKHDTLFHALHSAHQSGTVPPEISGIPGKCISTAHTVTHFCCRKQHGLIHGKLYRNFFPFFRHGKRNPDICRDMSAINQQIQTCKQHQYQFCKPNQPNRNASIDQRNITCANRHPCSNQKTAHIYPLSLLYVVGLSTSDRISCRVASTVTCPIRAFVLSTIRCFATSAKMSVTSSGIT